ncbi:uncharacterized protein [Palaemon carinicauda]|uniref:uncharacterized protein n=1 Tax=Palaemon carinicauda TaxID=392227 RepID=UPI0035B6693B
MDRSPAPRSPYGQLHSQAKAVIYSVNRYFLEEKANRGLILPPSEVVARTARATKTSEATVRRVVSEYNQSLIEEAASQDPTFSQEKKSRIESVTDFNELDKRALRRTVLGFYERKEIPTLDAIKEELSDKIGYKGCDKSLRRVLQKIGFKLAKFDGHKFMMERNDVVAARTRFLREIRQLKKSGHILVYLGESWITQNRIKVKPAKGKIGVRIVLLHAGTQDGFIDNGELIIRAVNDGDYRDKMNATVFEKWFRTQVLPNIPPKSVIVMDNASYQSRQEETFPTSSWVKEDIENWLEEKGIAVGNDLPKAELYELTKNFRKDRRKKYVVDAMATEAGHIVLRLPPYHCHYNPIDLIWAQVKSYVAPKKNNLKMAEVKPLVEEAMRGVTSENWKQAITFVEELQEDDTKQDRAVEIYVDSFVTHISESSDEFSD